MSTTTTLVVPPKSLETIAYELSLALKKAGLDVRVEYDDSIDGVKDGLVFYDNSPAFAPEPLSMTSLKYKLKDVEEVLKLEDNKYSAGADEARGKLAWLQSFKQFMFEDSDWAGDKVAVISEEAAQKKPFKRLLANADVMEKLQPVNWDLNEHKMSGVVKALNNIAHMEGAKDVHFQLEAKTGKITYYSNSLSKAELSKKVTSIIEHIVATDSALATDGVLNEDGKQVASKMDAFKNDRYYVAFEKETGFKTDYLVDLAENARIAIAAKSYLNYAKVSVDNKEPYDIQKQNKVIKTEDGKDTYDFLNKNLFSGGSFNDEAAIPQLKSHSKYNGNFKLDATEAEMIAELNKLRGTMPVDFAPDATPVAPVTPKQSAPKAKKQTPATKHRSNPANGGHAGGDAVEDAQTQKLKVDEASPTEAKTPLPTKSKVLDEDSIKIY